MSPLDEYTPSPDLIAEQLRHALDLLRAENATIRSQLSYDREFMSHRLNSLEAKSCDQETRIRNATDGVTSFKTWSALVGGFSTILAILAFIMSLR